MPRLWLVRHGESAGNVARDRAGAAGAAAIEIEGRDVDVPLSELDAVVALKGEITHIAAPDRRQLHSTAGGLGLGTAGSGDVLAGVIGGLCARGAEPLQAAVWGVHLHGRAGDVLARRVGPLGYLARELLDAIPGVLARIAGPARARR